MKKLSEDRKKIKVYNVISVGFVKIIPTPKGKRYANKNSIGETANAMDGISIF